MSNLCGTVMGTVMSVYGIVGMIDPSTIEDWIKTGSLGTGTLILLWVIKYLSHENKELRDKLLDRDDDDDSERDTEDARRDR